MPFPTTVRNMVQIELAHGMRAQIVAHGMAWSAMRKEKAMLLVFISAPVLSLELSIPTAPFSPLSHLQTLNLSSNHFSGSPFPPQFGMLTNLRVLDLSSSSFQISHLSKLVSLHLSSNYYLSFSNLVMNQLVPNLTNLRDFRLTSTNLPDNPELNGHLPMSNWSKSLEFLDLYRTNFTGGIPSSIGEAKALRYLDLSFCNFNCEIAESIGNLTQMPNFRIHSNPFKGLIPDCVFNLAQQASSSSFANVCYDTLSNLIHLNLRNNSFTDMSSMNLEKIPYFLRNQKNLNYLDLSNNQIGGKIPEWVSELGGLSVLDLSHNLLSSGIELPLAMPNLNSVYLDFNLFNKLPVPMLLPSTMEYFSVSNNEVNGNVHPSICQATNLTYLDLSHNSLSGALPSCLSSITNLDILLLKSNNFSGVIPIPPRIQYYIASENQFIGEIPLSICHAINLRILNVSNNRMSGTIPPCLANITSLSVLDLKSNNFSGHFPYRLKAASSLQVLILRSNRFYGHINNSFNKDSFSNLQIIDLSRNHLSGPLPSNFFENMRTIKEVENQEPYSFFGDNYYYKDSIVISLKGLEQKLERILLIFKTIDLSSNDFDGEIPKEVGMLRSLVGLNLSHNKLTGGIPTSLSNLNNLEWLDLSSNQLFGSIPPQLVALTFLSLLNLSQNQLSGPIPQGKQFETFENSSYFENLGLCGNPLPKCDTHQDDHQSQQLHEEEDEEDKGIWVKAVFMGYGFGLVFGIFIGYLAFKCGKPVCIVAIVVGKKARKIQTSRKSCRPRKRNG
ncbi:unnamed protein product [Citrullus colocynthis]|uniref:Uncharacterized protein n=1 Tax=Citrullus colocynthis TaxID=252529 RepID=A0ABP0Z765_9ROSI